MFLLDTNVWLELLLEQKDAEQVRRLMESAASQQLALTDFSLHSIGVILMRLKKDKVFLDFLSDALEESGVRLLRLDTADLARAPGVCSKFRLDFDDAYQYLAAEKYGMVLVSFDSDFDRTERGRKTPATAIETER
ncbi:MAG TPA: PIN domain-containing protein [Terriglobia bacterium]|nr:PIN domain-containing protein [Terriglobia bacterium]